MILILRLILVLLIVRAVLMLVRGAIQGARTGGPVSTPPPGVQLMRDPICGVYVTPAKALTERSGVGTAYFCSEQCREAWRRR